MSFALGNWVTWKSQANGYWKEKTGKIVEVVPARARPNSKIKEPGLSRQEESYVVKVGSQLYWPRVSGLRQSEDLESSGELFR